ncbi:MAG: MdtA/MuxA family multidrug efflux RND transporter periplasmic adaptor subunit [Acidobacteriaceae bacterium]|nr:MdtA/MuxA family multidrug efflux RND transporter periplasmic adaptor subunit [Acidobacteriaceae bacterium]MBV9780022.1 MdtA/MuxA family multidrug efflux RND transporter periplasmic adaptor subunit [Acidobacteriaceae bacterium]
MSADSDTAAKSNPPAHVSSPAQQRRRGSRRRRAIWIGLLCFLLCGGYLLSQRAPSGQTPDATKSGQGGGRQGRVGNRGRQGPAVIPVAVDTVRQGDIGVYINALGTVTPVYTVTVTSRVVGELKEVHYREGQIVHKGDLLAVIDPRPYQAVLTQAQGQLARDQALLKNAYIDLDRYKTIYQQRAIPEQQLATQQATVEQDEGIVKLDEGNLEAAKVNVDYSRITAPITGRVGLRLVDPGNIVQANGTTGLLTITQLQPITVIFTIAEDYLSDVTTQMRAGHKLRVDALDRTNQTEIAQGTVLTIDNQVDTTTGTVKVRAIFSNKDYRLFPNEFVNAKLLVRTLSNVNLIPTAAIQRNNDIAFVYVVKADSTVQSRNISIATTEGNTAAVTGVAPGERLVTDGFDKLQDGVKISVRKPIDTSNQMRTPRSNQAATQTTPPPQGNARTRLNTSQQNPQQPVNPK